MTLSPPNLSGFPDCWIDKPGVVDEVDNDDDDDDDWSARWPFSSMSRDGSSDIIALFHNDCVDDDDDDDDDDEAVDEDDVVGT